MAKREVTVITDDIDRESKAVESFTYTWEGVVYEIDLNKVNANEFKTTMEWYVQHSTRVGGKKKTVTSTTWTRGQAKVVRAWAIKKGLPNVPTRGRLPKWVIDAYNKKG